MKSILLLWMVLGGVMMGQACADEHNKVKEARLAGSWYPGDKAGLSRMLDGFFTEAPDGPADADIGVIVSPHAGYAFSGAVAAHGFKTAMPQKIATVIILAPTHHYSFAGASVWAEGSWATPLGSVAVDTELAGKILAADGLFSLRRDVFDGKPGRPENSVETQVPFIQKAVPQAKIVPIIMGYPPDIRTARAVADALVKAVGSRDDVLLVVSVDQSHFHPLAEARAIDARGLAVIGAMDIDGLWQGHRDGQMEVDGFHAVTAGILYARARGYAQARVLKYGTSADTTADASSVVGYASVAFYRTVHAAGAPLTDAQKAQLLAIARTTLDAFVTTGKAPAAAPADPRLLEEEGAFVTLKARGALRGCIGHIIGRGPLASTVREMAIAAASQDPRFQPVTARELKDIDVEISVLSKPRVTKDPGEIVMGTHGVIVTRGGRGGVFLPQVATETGWSRERFLAELCTQKAGLPADCWKDAATRLEIFTADVFGEKEK
jgi:MEMO1 family protein